MGRVWIFEETGEARKPKKGEWFLHGGSITLAIFDFDTSCFPILKLTESPSNPLEPIREVANRKESNSEKRILFALNNPKLGKKIAEDFVVILSEIKIYRQAVQKSIAIMEAPDEEKKDNSS